METLLDVSPYGDHLPIFPWLMFPVTENKIERAVERLFDRADDALMSGRATQSQYDAWSKACGDWADRQYAMLARV